MADNVGYSTGSGVSIAADDIGGVLHQRVKVVLGADGASDGDVNATNPMPVSGTVSVSGGVGTTVVSGTVTVLPGVSVSAVVSGTVTVAGAVAISGTGLVSVVPGVSVTIQQGASVSAVVSGTVSISGAVGASGTVSILDIVPVVTQASVSVTGLPVWMNPTQAVVVNTIAAGFSVNALVTGAVSISAMPAVSLSVSAALGTVITILGTQVVSVVPGVSVNVGSQATGIYTTTATSGVTGPIVWLGVGQTMAAMNTIVTILGTQIVSVVPGVSVNALVTGAVSISAMPAISGAVSISAIAASQTIGTIVTVLGTQIVSIAQTSVSVAVVPTVSTIVTILGTQMVSMAQTSVSVAVVPTISTVVTVLGTVAVTQVGYLYTTTGVTTGTAQAVWIMNPTTATVTVSVSAPFGDVIAFSFTTVSAPTVLTPALCDVSWLGTTVQTSMYVVPAGRRLRIMGIAVQVQNTAASIGFGRAIVEVRASLSSSVTVGPVVLAGYAAAPSSATNAGGNAMMNVAVDVSTTMSVGFAYRATGLTGAIVGFVITGELF